MLTRVRSAIGGIAAIAALLVTASVVEATSAAWSDPAHMTAAATAGTWVVAPANWCEVRNVTGGAVDSTKTCTVTGPVTVSFWGSAGAREGYYRTYFSAPTIANNQYIAFTVTLSGTPAGWSWSNAGLTRLGGGTVTSACSALPVVSGRLDPNQGYAPQFYVDVVESRTGRTVICL